MKALRFLLAFALAAAIDLPVVPASAQTAVVVSSCGGATYTVGQQYPLQQTATGLQCSSATLSGSVTVGNATITAPLGARSAATSVSTTVNGNPAVVGVGTPGTQSGGVLTVQGDPSGTAINVASGVAQGSATSGVSLSPIGCRTLTAAPTDTTAQNNIPRCFTDGSLAVTLPAGTAILGKVGIDQTTPGTTNGVAIAPSSAAGVGLTPVISAAAENNHVLKASAGNLYGAYATNLTSTPGFLQIFNATSAPSDGAVTPAACVALPPTGTANISRSPGPPAIFSTGITAVVSSASTCFTKTTGVITAFISGDVQ